MTTLSASFNNDGGFTDHVLKETMIRERQFDLATEKMLGQVSLLSDGVFIRSTMYQLSLHSVDGTDERNIAFAPIRERSEQSEEKKIFSLRVADFVAILVIILHVVETAEC